VEDEGEAVALLVFEFLIQRHVAARRADPAFLAEDHRHRRLFNHRVHAEFDRRLGFGNQRAARAERGILGIFLAQRLEIAFQPGALFRGAFQQRLQFGLLGQQRVLFLAQFHFLQLAQRPQPHIEDRFGLPVGKVEFGHHQRLGLILRADDFDHPVKVEKGDDVTAHQFQA